MSDSLQGVAVTEGIVIGRATVMASTSLDIERYFIEPHQVAEEIKRGIRSRNEVLAELEEFRHNLPPDAPQELDALLEVHTMLLLDEELQRGVIRKIRDRLYNVEWAISAQMEDLARQFDEMQDPYLRERKADLEQVVERLLLNLKGRANRLDLLGSDAYDRSQGPSTTPLILVARDLSPADMLQFKQSPFKGFVTEVGGKTSHTAIVARSMDIPAVVGVKHASSLIKQDDMLVIDGQAGQVWINPSEKLLGYFAQKLEQGRARKSALRELLHTPSFTLDGVKVELLANIEEPSDTAQAMEYGAVGVGLFRSEFLFMGRAHNLPSEDEQYEAYRTAVVGMRGLPVTIRTLDVGADKPLGNGGQDCLNPALGLRAIRWSLAQPAMFLAQLRAILRASAHGKVKILLPMLTNALEIKLSKEYIALACKQLDEQGIAYGAVEIGAMIEVPAAAMQVSYFLTQFDFLSIGTNDLVQYLLAIDRADESVAHLYDPMHPAVLGLLHTIIQAGVQAGKSVSLCGELAGDAQATALLLGLGLRQFSMHPTQMLAVKEQIVQTDCTRLQDWVQSALQSPVSLDLSTRPGLVRAD